ncbi:MAG: hypothetical protein DMG75_06540 [Acidobacteria bacterium]|nr:MAG: hypothetical protein DMG75_06540 [Acidobacteriota bacterium]
MPNATIQKGKMPALTGHFLSAEYYSYWGLLTKFSNGIGSALAMRVMYWSAIAMRLPSGEIAGSI